MGSDATKVVRAFPDRMALSLRPLNPDLYPPGVFCIPRQSKVFRVGREKGNDLQVNHASVSALHAKIEASEEAGVAVFDCGSSNGTFLNGIQVVERRQLAVGDLLRFATAEFRVTAAQEIPGNDETDLSDVTAPVFLFEERKSEREQLLGEERDRLATELADLTRENVQLRIQIENAQQMVGGRDVEIAALSGKLREQEAILHRVSREVEDLAQREQRSQSQLSETRKTLMEREGSIAALQYEITKRDGNLRQLDERLIQLQTAYDQYVAAYGDSQAELETRNVELAREIEARHVAETRVAGVEDYLSRLADRLLADWRLWFDGGGENGASLDADSAFSRVEEVATRIRGELDLIEPIWKQYGTRVQAELSRRCDELREEGADLLAETEARRVVLDEVSANLDQFRELIDTEVRRAQGLSRRGTEIEIPERFESMIIARDREQEIYRSLIERLEVLDRLLEGYRHSRKLREVVLELTEFRTRLVAILDASGVQVYWVPVKTMLTLKHRKEVQILSRKGWGTRQYTEHPFQPGEVVKVIRPGYRVGEGDNAVILRKVEVLIRGIGD